MTNNKKVANPFYVLLLAAGVLFSITACAYGVMMLKGGDAGNADGSVTSSHRLIEFLDRHGAVVMTVELAVLAVATFAAIGTDDYWTRRAAAKADHVSKPNLGQNTTRTNNPSPTSRDDSQ